MLFDLSCLGQFKAHVEHLPVRFATEHGRALLAYLAVEADRTHARTYLAFLLWPDHPEPQALNNFRQTLVRLRQTLDMGDELAALLEITPKSIQLHATHAKVDVRDFQALVAQCKAHNHPSLERCAECLPRLEQAAALYKGEFLQGLSLRHSQPFNEWATYVREELHHQIIVVLHTLALHYEEVGDFARARSYVARQLTLEPWHEEAHRQMMRVLAKSGHRAAAILQYETARRVLQEELSMAPAAETTLLYERIKADTFADVAALGERAPILAPTPSLITNGTGKRARHSELPSAPRLFGRTAELAQVERWLIHDHTQLLTVVGMGGIGKTSLTIAGIEAVAHHYDILLWRSLLNAPTLDEILRDWLGLLAADSLTPLPDTVDAQLALLLHHLRERRCLLILDNLESILHADQAGHVRPDYADFELLFQQVAETQHRSCLVLTSREQLQGIALLDESHPWVRTLRLTGLEAAAAQTLLMGRDLQIEMAQASTLVNRYSGNPLALKLVGETIQEIFEGNVARFLAADVVIFDDIRAVLEQQFERLPPLEQEILLWLAIERDPVSLETLGANLSPIRSAPDTLQAMRALQRRSLLHHANRNHTVEAWPYAPELWTETRFATSNVIMEYLVDRLVQAACREIEQGELGWLHRHALMQAQAKEYVRQSQERLILTPVVHQLEARLGRNNLSRKLRALLDGLRAETFPPRSYAAGNLLNSLLLLGVDVTGLDLSGLAVWQADLRYANLAQVNFAGADLTRSRFADAFGIVYAAAISPDGTLVAGGTNDGEIRLWDAHNGQLLQIFAGHQGPTRSLAFHPNGKLLASCGDDHRVRLWRLELATVYPRSSEDALESASQHARILEGHVARVFAVAFHPTGTMLASVSADQTARLWDVVSGETRAVLTQHDQPIRGVAFSPDGSTLATGDDVGIIRLWDPQTAELRATLIGHTIGIMALAFAPNNRWLASGSHDNTVGIWDFVHAEKAFTLEGMTDAVTCLAFSPDSNLLAYGSDDHLIHLYDTTNWKPIRQLQGHTDSLTGVVFGAGGQTLVSCGGDHKICLWELPSARIRRIFSGYSRQVNTLAYHPTGQLLASGHYDRSVRLWDTATRQTRQTLLGHRLAVKSIAFSPTGEYLASASHDKNIQLWSIPPGQSGEARRRFLLRGHRRAVRSIAFLPNSKLLVSSSEDLTVGIWDVENGQPNHFMVLDEGAIGQIQSNHAGNVVATMNDFAFRLWPRSLTELYREVPGHALYHFGLAFSHDDHFLAMGGSDGSIALWDVRDPTQPALKHILRGGHRERVFVVAFSPDGRFFASAGADHTICLWDAQSHALLQSLRGHTHWISAIAFSPDSNTLASGGIDETIRLWETQSGQILATLAIPGPYAGMNIQGITGISDAEYNILKDLGAID